MLKIASSGTMGIYQLNYQSIYNGIGDDEDFFDPSDIAHIKHRLFIQDLLSVEDLQSLENELPHLFQQCDKTARTFALQMRIPSHSKAYPELSEFKDAVRKARGIQKMPVITADDAKDILDNPGAFRYFIGLAVLQHKSLCDKIGGHDILMHILSYVFSFTDDPSDQDAEDYDAAMEKYRVVTGFLHVV